MNKSTSFIVFRTSFPSDERESSAPIVRMKSRESNRPETVASYSDFVCGDTTWFKSKELNCHAEGLWRSANPLFNKLLEYYFYNKQFREDVCFTLIVAQEWKYASSNLFGSGVRSANSIPFTFSPLNDGYSFPSTISVSEERGLAYWPAILAILTTDVRPPQTRIKDIWRRTFILFSIFVELQ